MSVIQVAQYSVINPEICYWANNCKQTEQSLHASHLSRWNEEKKEREEVSLFYQCL